MRVEQEEGVLRDLLGGREEEQPGAVRGGGGRGPEHEPGVLPAGLLPRLPRHLAGLRLVQRRLPRDALPPEEGCQGAKILLN